MLQVRAEQVGVIEAGVLEVAIGQDGACEIGVAKVLAAEIQPLEVLPGEHRPRPARLGAPEPVVPGADGVDLRLGELLKIVLLRGAERHGASR